MRRQGWVWRAWGLWSSQLPRCCPCCTQEMQGSVQLTRQSLSGVAGQEGQQKVGGAGQVEDTSRGVLGMVGMQICTGAVGSTGALQQQRQQKAGGGVGQGIKWQIRLQLTAQQQQQQPQQCLLYALPPCRTHYSRCWSLCWGPLHQQLLGPAAAASTGSQDPQAACWAVQEGRVLLAATPVQLWESRRSSSSSWVLGDS